MAKVVKAVGSKIKGKTKIKVALDDGRVLKFASKADFNYFLSCSALFTAIEELPKVG